MENYERYYSNCLTYKTVYINVREGVVNSLLFWESQVGDEK